jgi:putative ABC transport system permease protein
MLEFLRKLRALVQRERINQDLQQEMSAHLELRSQEYEKEGVSPEQARHRAQQKFGNRTALLEQAGETWAFPRFESVLQDLRYGARGLRRNPAFSLTAIFIVAVGIGAPSAVFSVVDRLLFRSLPYPDSDRLVSVGISHPILDGEFLLANDYLHLRELQTPFAALASWTGVADCDLTEQNPLRLSCAQMDAAFLPTFGVQPVLGRHFTAAEDRLEARKVALISYGLWQSRFAADPRAIGKSIPVDGIPTEIIGVLPRDFELPTLQRADLVLPQALKLTQYRPGETGRPVRVFGRLKDGVTVEQARQMLHPSLESALEFVPRQMRQTAAVVLRSVRDFQIQDVKLASWALFGTTLAILLIVCANVANLLLARSAARQREFTMRIALGAGRARLIRQTFTESLLLSVLATAPGCGLAWMLLRVFKALAPTGIPRIGQAALDSRVLLFTVLMTLCCGILLGLAPAFASLGVETLTSWRASPGSRTGARRILTTAQIAVSLILLSDAGLLLESLWRMQRVAPGLNTGQVVTANITVGPQRYPNAAVRQQFFDDLLERLQSIPTVAAVAVSDTVPPSGFIHNKPLSGLRIPGQPPREPGVGGMVSWRAVSPAYFTALQIPILRGRAFREEDRSSTEDTIVISASLGRRLFPDADPIGRVIHVAGDRMGRSVIGVAADVDNAGAAGHSDPEYYVLRKKITDPDAGRNEGLVSRSLHVYDGAAFVIVRSAARPGAVANWIRTEAAALDPTVPVTISTMEQRIHAVVERPRFNAFLLTLFALIGVLLAASGLYGLISFLVVQRTQEIGVRIALGATPAKIAGLVLQDALRWTATGVAIGLAGAAITARSLSSILFQVRAGNPLLFGGAALLLVAIALAAAALPSLRASHIDPVEALRQQ